MEQLQEGRKGKLYLQNYFFKNVIPNCFIYNVRMIVSSYYINALQTNKQL